jgi:cytoskeleton protein RodZ
MSLGLLIAKARNDSGLSLELLSEKTNIRQSVLSEIEKDNFSNCGGKIYARAHVRNIAKALGADQKEFIRLFEEEQGSETRSMQDLLAETNVIGGKSEARKVSWKVLILISVFSLAIVGITQIIISNSNSNKVGNEISSETPQPFNSGSPSTEVSNQDKYSTGSGVAVTVSATRGNSWLLVSDSVGVTLFSGQISMGSTKVFTSDISLNLKLGNAGGVDLTVNGNAVDPVGLDGEVVSVSYGVDS